tara:strand:- start:1384 stop:1674 length:291 start_codon:yes stop_codon:yes gene_type:complete
MLDASSEMGRYLFIGGNMYKDYETEPVYPERDKELPSWEKVAEQLAIREGKDKPMSRQCIHMLYKEIVKKVRIKLQRDPFIKEFLEDTKENKYVSD